MSAPAATLASPTRTFLALLRILWHRHRCGHADWTPLDPWCCPGCGKAS